MSRKIFAILLMVAFTYVALPLLLPVVMGGVFAILFFPLLKGLQRARIRPAVGSAVLTVGFFVLFLLPMAILIYQGAKTAFTQLQALKDIPAGGGSWMDALIQSPRVYAFLQRITDWFPVQMSDLTSTFHDLAGSVALRAADLLGSLVTHLPGMTMAVAVMVVSTYFFLLDGSKVVSFIRRNTVFTSQETDELILTLGGICRSVVLASVVSGAVQGAFFTFVCMVTQAPSALLIGLLCFIASFIPLIGTAPVTFGVALQQVFEGHTVAGVILLVAASIVIMMDNVIRPWFLRGSANLHPLLAFVAAFGGIQTLGFLGVFLGPILAAMVVATIQILTRSGGGGALGGVERQ